MWIVGRGDELQGFATLTPSLSRKRERGNCSAAVSRKRERGNCTATVSCERERGNCSVTGSR
jgi:hypothetical protein